MIRNTAVTVCGPLNVNKLGVTYVHEHLMVKPQLPVSIIFLIRWMTRRLRRRRPAVFPQPGVRPWWR